MSYHNKTKQQLIEELTTAHERIAELEMAQQAKQADAATVNAILEVLPDLMFRLSADGTHLEFYAPHHSQLFVQPEVFLGKPVTDVLPNAVATQYIDHIQRCLAQGQKQIFEYYLDFVDRGRLHYEAYMVVAGEDEVIVLVHDITRRKLAEQKIRQLGERFSVLFHASPAVITLADIHDGRFVEVNTAFETALGFTRDEAVGRTTTELNIWVNQGVRLAYLNQLKEHRSLKNMEMQFRTKSGEIRTFLGSFAILTIDNQTLILSALIDMTEHKRLEEEAKRAEILKVELEKEKEVVALKDRFISVVSHEFRTPLAVIQSSSDILSRYYEQLSDERRAEIFQQIKEQIEELTDMTDGVLSINRTKIGKTDFVPTLTDIAPFCRSIFEQIKQTDAGKHQFAFVSSVSDQHVMVDRNLLNHIITNLLTNAVKYSPEKSRIILEVTQDSANLTIRISDEGIGVPEEDQARLFEPFHRASNVGNIRGTGMGLSIVREYVELHGGRIEVMSTVGKGSTFIMTLPNT